MTGNMIHNNQLVETEILHDCYLTHYSVIGQQLTRSKKPEHRQGSSINSRIAPSVYNISEVECVAVRLLGIALALEKLALLAGLALGRFACNLIAMVGTFALERLALLADLAHRRFALRPG